MRLETFFAKATVAGGVAAAPAGGKTPQNRDATPISPLGGRQAAALDGERAAADPLSNRTDTRREIPASSMVTP